MARQPIAVISHRSNLHRIMAGVYLILVIAFVSVIGCNHSADTTARIDAKLPPNADDKQQIEFISAELDDVAKGVEQFGTISMSAPVLAPPTTQAFQFTLTAGPDNFYSDAKQNVQGRAAALDQQSFEAGLSMKFQAELAATLGYLSNLQAYGQDLSAYHAKRELGDQSVRDQANQILTNLPADATPQQKLAAEAQRQQFLSQNLSGPTTRPSYPQPPTVNLPTADAAPTPAAAKAVLTTQTFTPLGGLLTGSGATISDRSAIGIAAGDTATKAIFSLLSNPQQYVNDFKDKKILFGVSMVAVSPGWRTREGYAGDITIGLRYEYVDARQELINEVQKNLESYGADLQKDPALSDLEALLIASGRVKKPNRKDNEHSIPSFETPVVSSQLKTQPRMRLTRMNQNAASDEWESTEGDVSNLPRLYALPTVTPTPVVSAVSPMTDSDVLNLSSGIRNQQAIALQLSAALQYAGLSGQSSYFQQFAHRFEKDLQTASATAVVSTYSHLGGIFGFQIGPRLKALADPTADNAKAAETLERQTFPVLFIVGLDAGDLKLRFARINGQLHALEPVIVFEQRMRWLPVNKPPRFDWPWDEKFDDQRLSEVTRLKWLTGLIDAQQKIDDLKEKDARQSIDAKARIHTLSNYLLDRIRTLRRLAVDSYEEQFLPISAMSIPAAKPDAVVSVDPLKETLHGYKDRQNLFFITGDHLDKLSTTATIGNQQADVKPIGSKTALISFPAAGANVSDVLKGAGNSPLPITVSAPGIKAILVGTITLDQPPQEPGAMPEVTLTRDSAGRIIGVVVKQKGIAFDPNQLIRILHDAIGNDPNFKLNVGSSGSFNYQMGADPNANQGPPPNTPTNAAANNQGKDAH